MDDIQARLIRCFEVVFQDLDADAAANATADSVASWDSVATVTLINVVEEEFGMEIGLEDVERMTSFPELLAYVRSGRLSPPVPDQCGPSPVYGKHNENNEV